MRQIQMLKGPQESKQDHVLGRGCGEMGSIILLKDLNTQQTSKWQLLPGLW